MTAPALSTLPNLGPPFPLGGLFFATARQDQAGQSRTGDGAGNRGGKERDLSGDVGDGDNAAGGDGEARGCAASLGAVGLDWQVGGFAADPSTVSSASAGSSSQVGQLVQAMAGFGVGGSESLNPTPLADTTQQPLITTPHT